MAIYEYSDYKKFVLDRVNELPGGGYGAFSRMAKTVKLPSSTLSLVFKGSRELTPEQAIDVAGFLKLGSLESEYFVTLVEKSRAGHQRLRDFVDGKLARLRKKAADLTNRIRKDRVLGPAEKYEFYSDWYYSATRLLSSVPGFHDTDSIAQHLGLPKELVRKVVDFLLSCGLCTEKNGELHIGSATTHIGPDDPLAFRHLQNWHNQAVRRILDYPKLDDHELCISMPFTSSAEALARVKKLFLDTMVSAVKEIDEGKAERIAYLNVDLLDCKVRGRKKS